MPWYGDYPAYLETESANNSLLKIPAFFKIDF